ncbi:magnesium-translocating P-type ATPase [Sinorhizobium fredii]|uniref:magnesium-translocating P-type ATPase n=1 Tax=Rhizobium fredii TaxID=380 RepID=UPI0035120B47
MQATGDEQASKAPYWAQPLASLLAALDTGTTGLASTEARRRLARFGRNTIRHTDEPKALQVLLRQFRSPLVLILVFAAGMSALVGEVNEAVIITLIVLISCGLSFIQEYRASRAVEALRRRISHRALVLRDGKPTSLLAPDVVPGDVILMSAGTLVPADAVVFEAREFNVSEAALTGEAYPVVKSPELSAPDAPLFRRSNVVFTGTSVRSGTARVVAVRTGNDTEFAAIAAAIERGAPETEFARGIRRFGYLMTEIMLAIVIVVFSANLLLQRPPIDSLLFSIALAVGLSPELLPAIVSITLARGARAMARKGVIVRRLESIENLGSMNILCTDKTGTLTEGNIRLDACLDVDGRASGDVLMWARLNATLQTGLQNPLDEAITSATAGQPELASYAKVDEIPYDFVRKRLSVIVLESGPVDQNLLICKGAVPQVLEASTSVLENGRIESLDVSRRLRIDERFHNWSEEGFRVLGLAVRRSAALQSFGRDEERDLTFVGFLLFLDTPKAGITQTLTALSKRGIGVKLITGDNRHVAVHLANAIGLRAARVMTGEQLSQLTKDTLFGCAAETDLFVEIDPNQKERIIEALRRAGHVVGYLGDGINDAPAMHEADVGISVDNAVDVAREAADIVLLKRDLDVLLQGIDDGRKSFVNTMKYISITTSANFGNMMSMALASMFLPFLPLLAKQILLNNLLSDVPSLAIADDNVDREETRLPRRWDISHVRRFMVSFGLVSSFFDILTFSALIFVVRAGPETFQTGWFIESLITELAIVFVVRTKMPFWRSRPGQALLWLSAAIALLAVALPYLPVAGWFGFVPISGSLLAGLLLISLLYLVASEFVKHHFFAAEHRAGHRRARSLPRSIGRRARIDRATPGNEA